MFNLIVTVVVLLNGEPYGDPQLFFHRDGPFATQQACEAVAVQSIPTLSEAIAVQLNGRQDEAFRLTHECSKSPDVRADEIQALLRSMTLNGGFGNVR